MRVTYHWTEREWDEAVRLAAQRRTRTGTPLPGLTYALVGLPLLGAALDLRSTLRENHGITLAGSILPLILLLVGITAAVLLSVSAIRRRRRRASAAPMPTGEWELVMQEAGWRCDGQVGTAVLPELQATGETETTDRPLLPWSDMVETRQGDHVIVFIHKAGFEALPTGGLTPEQGGHMHRLVVRKLRPSV